MMAYKLMRLKKDGSLGSLFIGRSNPIPMGEWLISENLPTKGFAVRQGWHCCYKPLAPHLKQDLASGERRVWVEVEVEGCVKYERPESQGGAWLLADRVKIIRPLSDDEVRLLLK